ncbi:recombinase family protein [Phytomonospora sp. NPDC050363]|uniref:recombinase family protein n=1 Tax=Phytomonospora sp. NPDC050363 TaxID=3155642 RepID=UPI0033D5FDEA
MSLTPIEAAAAVERHACPKCSVPPGSACRTHTGLVATKYHTQRFVLVPKLAEDLDVLVPADRGPGRAWEPGPAPAAAGEGVDAELLAAVAPPGAAVIRVGYARCSTTGQDLDVQLKLLAAAGCTKVFSEKISSRRRTRPEYEAALALAKQIREAAPEGVQVVFCVSEMKRLARNAAELMTVAADLEASGIALELLGGPLSGVYDPRGPGALLFAVLAVAVQLDRAYIREKTLEGTAAAAAQAGRHGGRPRVIDDDMLTAALALREKGLGVEAIASRLTIPAGKNAGKHPSVASVYRALAAADHHTT